MILLLYSGKSLEYPKVKMDDISLLTYAQTSKILNLEVRHIKDRIRNLYYINTEEVSDLLRDPPFPIYNKPDILIWEDNFLIKADSLNWETLNIVMILSGSIDKVKAYHDILDCNVNIHQDILYLSVQLQEIAARVKEFTSKRNKYDYFDISIATKILRKRKVKYRIANNRIMITIPDVKIGNKEEGFIIYNNIYIFISRWNVIDGYILRFNNFSFSSFWKIQDVVLHPFLFDPYYVGMPYLDISYEAYIDNLIGVAKGYNYGKPGLNPISIENIIEDFNHYRRIWNGIKDPRLEDSMQSYKKIFVK